MPPGFPAYLQGMETRCKCSQCRRSWRVPSLPTRNGNNIGLDQLARARMRSQPTYKEWKHLSPGSCLRGPGSSQPTYKEWKLNSLTLFRSSIFPVPSLPTRNGNCCRGLMPSGGTSCSQPTYKEWKRDMAAAMGVNILVPSLPTRNGNRRTPLPFGCCQTCSQPTYKEWKRAVVMDSAELSMLFPAYLQGMETKYLR